jgi:aspartate kinase
MSLIIQKYSQTYVANVLRIKSLAEYICNTATGNNSTVVIIPAIAEMIDEWTGLANQISTSPCKRERNLLLTTARQVSISLLTMALQELGKTAISLNETQIGTMSDLECEYSIDLNIQTERIKKCIDDEKIVVISDLQHINEVANDSDDSFLAALAIHLQADSYEIYKDQNGLFTASRQNF